MSQINPVMFSAQIQLSGNADAASFCVRVFDGVGREQEDEVIHYHNVLKLDGGTYGPNEWLHELLVGTIEFF